MNSIETIVKCSTYKDEVEFNMYDGCGEGGGNDYWVNITEKNGDHTMAYLTEAEMTELRDNILKALPLSPKETITPPAVDTAKPHGAPGWEDVWDFEDVGVQRLRVAGGWLYMTCFTDEDTNTPLMSTVFVPAV